MARDDRAGKDKDTGDTTSAAERGGVSGGSGRGASTGGRTGGSGNYSGKGGLDSPSESGPGPGAGGGSRSGGGSGGKGTSPSEGYGQAAASMGAAGVSGIGGGSRSGETSRSGGGGANLAGSVGSYSNARAGLAADRPDNRDSGGPRGLGGPGGTYVGGVPSDVAREYARAAETMNAAGIGSVGGLMTASNPPTAIPDVTHRQTEIASMAALRDLNLDTWTGAIIGVESANNPRAKNPNSTATGLGQFTEGTWMDMMSKSYPDVVSSLTRQEVLDLRYDPTYSRAMTRAYLDRNLSGLEKQGLPVNAATAYMTHFLGPTGAAKTLSAAPNTAMSDIVPKDVINANRPIFNANPTAQDIIDWAGRKMEGATRNRAFDQTPADAPTPTSNPGVNATVAEVPSRFDQDASRFAEKYLGGSTTARRADTTGAATATRSTEALSPVDPTVAAYRDYASSRLAAPASMPSWQARAQRFRDTYISPHLSLEAQGFTEADLMAQTPEVDRAPVGSVAAVAPSTTQQPSVSIPGRVAAQPTTPPSTVQPVGPGATVSPASPASTTVAPTPTESAPIEPSRPRGVVENVVAGGIDVLAGLVPGAGIGASVFNAGAALTGHRTIGQHIVDDFMSGTGEGRPARTRDSDGGEMIHRDLLAEEDSGEEAVDASEEPPADTTTRFVRKYLTPTEKWGRARGLMSAAGAAA